MRRKRQLLVTTILAVSVLLIISLLAYFVLQLTCTRTPPPPADTDHTVWGVDVSSYQGTIDWAVLESAGVSFAFIKATEGTDYIDSRLADNLAGAADTGIKYGAYHFFRFDASGKEQAELFIRAVPKKAGMLPPVIDIELYGDYEQSPPNTRETRTRLLEMAEQLEKHYGVKPIIYANLESYRLYISGAFTENTIWISRFSDIQKPPSLPDGRAWTFWQHSETGRLDGYKGTQKYIDLNVFMGDEKAFGAFWNKHKI